MLISVPVNPMGTGKHGMNEQIFILNSQKKTTNHILHLILSLITMGFWVIIWVIVAFNNSNHNKRIQGQMNHVLNYKIQGMDDVQAYQHVKADRERHDSIKRKALFVIGVVVLVWLYTKTL